MTRPHRPSPRRLSGWSLAPGRRGRTGLDAELEGLAARLAAVPAAEPRPAFVADLRERLVTEAADVLVPRAPAPPSRTGATGRRAGAREVRDRRVAAVLGTAAVLAASGSVGAASQAAVPGELLYPVKSVLESAHERITTGDRDKGLLLLTRAEARLDELEELVTRDDAGSRRAVASTLESLADQAEEGGGLLLDDFEESGRRSSVLAVRELAAGAMPRLEALAPVLPPEAHDPLVAAAEVLVALDDRAVAACPDCGGPEVLVVPRFVAAPAPGAADADAPLPLADGPAAAGSDPAAGAPRDGTPPPGAAQQGEPGATPASPSPSPGASPTDGPTPGPTPGPTDPPSTGPSGQPSATATPRPSTTPTPRRTDAPLEAEEKPTPLLPPPTPGLVEGLTEALVGPEGTGSTGGTGDPGDPGDGQVGGLVGGVGETLGEVTGTLLGTPAGEAVEQTTGGVRRLLSGVLRGLSGRPTPAP